jgi:hypothetical protein
LNQTFEGFFFLPNPGFGASLAAISKHIEVQTREGSQLLLKQQIIDLSGLFHFERTVIVEAPQYRLGDELLANLNQELLAIDVNREICISLCGLVVQPEKKSRQTRGCDRYDRS